MDVSETKKPASTTKVVIMSVLLLLLGVSLYNLFVAFPAEDRRDAKDRYVDRWFRTHVETDGARLCLHYVEGKGRVTMKFELVRSASGNFAVDRVSTDESSLSDGLTELVERCIEIGAPYAVFEPNGHFAPDKDRLTFFRLYAFPSPLR